MVVRCFYCSTLAPYRSLLTIYYSLFTIYYSAVLVTDWLHSLAPQASGLQENFLGTIQLGRIKAGEE